MLLYLIRHGKSVSNSSGVVVGTKEDVLSEEGVSQARALVPWLKKIGIEGHHYTTSTWKRARQTAEILWPDAKWRIDARVGETNAGEVADWQLDTFKSVYPRFFESTHNRHPGGESHEELNARVVEWLRETAAATATQEKVVLVGHAGSITCALQYVTGIGMDRFPAFLAPNASLSVAEIPPPNSRLLPRLLAFSLCPDDGMSRSYILDSVRWP